MVWERSYVEGIICLYSVSRTLLWKIFFYCHFLPLPCMMGFKADISIHEYSRISNSLLTWKQGKSDRLLLIWKLKKERAICQIIFYVKCHQTCDTLAVFWNFIGTVYLNKWNLGPWKCRPRSYKKCCRSIPRLEDLSHSNM